MFSKVGSIFISVFDRLVCTGQFYILQIAIMKLQLKLEVAWLSSVSGVDANREVRLKSDGLRS